MFMPRIDLWAVDTSQFIGESDSHSVNHHFPETNNSSNRDGEVIEESASSQLKCKSSEMVGDQSAPQSASHAWCSFIEQVESICVSTSLMILVC